MRSFCKKARSIRRGGESSKIEDGLPESSLDRKQPNEFVSRIMSCVREVRLRTPTTFSSSAQGRAVDCPYEACLTRCSREMVLLHFFH